jgi:hypothetical protein
MVEKLHILNVMLYVSNIYFYIEAPKARRNG